MGESVFLLPREGGFGFEMVQFVPEGLSGYMSRMRILQLRMSEIVLLLWSVLPLGFYGLSGGLFLRMGLGFLSGRMLLLRFLLRGFRCRGLLLLFH